jgi:hypothetical protein
MSTAAELTAHAGSTAVHTVATNLANRDTTGPDTGLVSIAQMAAGMAVPYHPNQALLFRGDGSPPAPRTWGYPKHASIGYNQAPKTLLHAAGKNHILELPVPAAWISDDMQFTFDFSGVLTTVTAPGSAMVLSLTLGSSLIAATSLDLSVARQLALHCSGKLLGLPTNKAEGSIWLMGWILGPMTPIIMGSPGGSLPSRTPGELTIYVDSEVFDGVAGESLEVFSGYIRALHPIP